ncbi:nucleotidyl transferase AbiEii/AbiGii toxin family protein [Dactylococcopsis salina]|uniref:nucleotidyl transferase AbiEii/AbiGii toxin family protein n=1 Tax=Dactylococcopsis salina TaxID=292566 RepID=UPI000A0149C9
MRIYPRETVVAEKFQAMVYLGISNSRMKDFYDLLFLAKNFEFKGQILKEAIEATFKRRKTSISEEIPLALTEEFTQNLAKEKAWKGFLNKNQLEPENPTLRDIIEELKLFLIPPYIAISKNQVFEKTWRPDQKWL